MSKNKGLTNLEIVLIIVVIILIYVITIGYVNLLERLEEKEESAELSEFDDKDNKDVKIVLSKLKYRHKRLREIISKNEEINNKLNRRFKFIYSSVKVIFVLLFLGFVATLYLGFGITDISNLLTWIGAFAILITVVSYLAFDSFNGVTDFNNSIKMKLESSIRSKCLSIEEKLPIYREEEKMLAEAITLEEEQIGISNQKTVEATVLMENRDEIV
jgi:ABC-type multidrug transport system fused ATPase/permease subunit